VVERGNPMDLLVEKTSFLLMTIKKVDKHLGKLIDIALEDGIEPKEIFSKMFKIPSWFKKMGYEVPLFEGK